MILIKSFRIMEGFKKKGEQTWNIFLETFANKSNIGFATFKHIFFSLMVKFDEVRTGGNMMPTATLAVGTTEGKISGKWKLKVKVIMPIAEYWDSWLVRSYSVWKKGGWHDESERNGPDWQLLNTGRSLTKRSGSHTI